MSSAGLSWAISSGILTAFGIMAVVYGVTWMLLSRKEHKDRSPLSYQVITNTGTTMDIIAYGINWEGGWIGFENSDGEYYRILPAHRISEIRQLSADFPYRTTEGVIHG